MADVIEQVQDEYSELRALSASGRRVSTASLAETVKALRDVILPTLGKGPLIRRRGVVGVAERAGLDDKAVKRMRALRRKYGAGPSILAIPFRPQALLLSTDDVRVVLSQSPAPFASATREKQSALDHFEPENVLACTAEIAAFADDLTRKRSKPDVSDIQWAPISQKSPKRKWIGFATWHSPMERSTGTRSLLAGCAWPVG